MFYLDKNKELTPALLYKMINRFQLQVKPKLEKYKNYYDGIQNILTKSYSDPSKPCNKTVINYCKNITDSYCGYLATPGHITYTSENDIEEIMNVLRYNDYQSEDSDFLKDALTYGVANELMYIDDEGKTRFKLIDPTLSFGVFDGSLTADLIYFVRMYKVEDWETEDETWAVDVYTDSVVKHYTMKGTLSTPVFINEEAHYFGQCPANIFVMPDEKSIFDCILSEQDSVNELLSSEIDDYSAFCDAYLVLEDCELEDGEVAEMKTNRVLQLPQGAKAYWLTKASNDVQIENVLKRLHDSIYRISSCVDWSSDNFTNGVSSGIAIQFKLSGMETRSGKIEAEMKKALQRRIEILCGMASLKLGEEVFRDIEITFTRNVPADEQAVINMVNSLQGLVSNETLLAQIPFITDVKAELERVEAQKKANAVAYGLPLFDDAQSDSEKEENDEI